jgi:uncharacterized membrane protein YqgA involved in biofilm formation
VPPGTGTLVNVVAILLGSAIGVALGDRLPERTRQVVTDGLGLVVLLVAALSAAAVLDPELQAATPSGAPVLIVLGSLLVGSIVGSLLRLESRLEDLGTWLRSRLVKGTDADGSHRFVEGFVTASLVFCVGPLAILGSLSDGLGNGIEQLALKATLDGFASIAFAAALGWGVAASALAVIAYQGFWTILGLALGSLLPPPEIAALTATGGLLLVGVALRLLRLRDVPVADMLPALVIAPLATALVAALV